MHRTDQVIPFQYRTNKHQRSKRKKERVCVCEEDPNLFVRLKKSSIFQTKRYNATNLFTHNSELRCGIKINTTKRDGQRAPAGLQESGFILHHTSSRKRDAGFTIRLSFPFPYPQTEPVSQHSYLSSVLLVSNEVTTNRAGSSRSRVGRSRIKFRNDAPAAGTVPCPCNAE